MPFSPPSGCMLWLKADGTLYQDSGETHPATADGDPVGAWADASGNSHDFTQSTAGSRPNLKLNIQNGLPIVRFDGIASVLTRAVDPVASGAHSIFAVIIERATPGNYNPVYISLASSTGQRMCLELSSTKWGTYVSFDAPANTTLVTATCYLLELLWDGSSAGNFYVNEVADGTFSSAPSGSNDIAQVGAERGASRFSQVDIGELFLFNSALGTSDRQSVENYLNTKWFVAPSSGTVVFLLKA